jgi:AAA15 family ATPase/GTPase
MENYTKFTIENFRCFSSEQTLVLAVPDQGKIGSGITYIVGPNNSGKTTLIESLNFRVDSSINSSDKRMGVGPKFIYYKDDNPVVHLTQAENSNKLIDRFAQKNDSHSAVIPSKKHWNPSITGHVTMHRTVKQSDDISSTLQNIANDGHKYAEFTKYVKQVFPEFNKWKVGYENNQSYIEYISQDGLSHKSDLLGDGVIAVIRILVHLFNKQSSALIIDEPELSLHPLTQKN